MDHSGGCGGGRRVPPTLELWDVNKVMIARYRYFTRDPVLEVFVPLDDYMLDLIVTAAVTVMVDDRKGLETVGKIIGKIV